MNKIKVLERMQRNYRKATKTLDVLGKTYDNILKKIDQLPNTIAKNVERAIKTKQINA